MPAVRFQHRRRGVIAADDDHIRLERHQARDQRIHFLDHPHLAVKIAALATGIGFLDMQVEEIKIVPVLFQRGKLIGERSSPSTSSTSIPPAAPPRGTCR